MPQLDLLPQLLAHEGFAVLQVNYRGSGGYGLAYEQAGYRKWGDRVVQDIVDATRFAVRKGFVRRRRLVPADVIAQIDRLSGVVGLSVARDSLKSFL